MLLIEHETLLASVVDTVNNITDRVALLTSTVNSLYTGLTISTLVDSFHAQPTYYTNQFTSIVENINLLSKQVITRRSCTSVSYRT